MLTPKPIHRESIPRALSKAERYRLLNEPGEAESICRDVLAADPANREAVACMILALTDQFQAKGNTPDEARGLVPRLVEPFDQAYFAGIIDERWAKALLDAKYPREAVLPLIHTAMNRYEKAQSVAGSGNDDALLRWNACVRFIDREKLNPTTAQQIDDESESLDDDVPMR